MWWLLILGLLLVAVVRFWPRALWAVLAFSVLLLAGVSYWHYKDAQALASVRIDIAHDLALCPAERPLSISIVNNGESELERILFSIHAVVPGYSGEVTLYTYKQYESSRIMAPGSAHNACYPSPPLSKSALAGTLPGGLQWSAKVVKVFFR